MRYILKRFLRFFLKGMAKLSLALHRPLVIAVAGSTNKSFVKDEIRVMLEKASYSVRATPRNFNTDIGMPLSILGLSSGYGDYRAWLPVLRQSVRAVFQDSFPRVLVLEFGVSDRGDMRYLLSIVRPDVVVLTDMTSRYVERFSGIDALANEYRILVHGMKRNDLLVVNGDSARFRDITKVFPGKRVSFGLSDGCDWQARDTERTSTGESFSAWRGGVPSKREHIDRFGEHHVLARLAALAVRESMADAFSERKRSAGR